MMLIHTSIPASESVLPPKGRVEHIARAGGCLRQRDGSEPLQSSATVSMESRARGGDPISPREAPANTRSVRRGNRRPSRSDPDDELEGAVPAENLCRRRVPPPAMEQQIDRALAHAQLVHGD